MLSWLRPFALPAAALVFVALALSSWRHGAAALLVVGVFAGGAALQFHPRHYFYLACLGYWPVTASLSALVRLPGRLLRGKVADAWPARDALAGATLIVAAVVVTVGGLALLRHYQAGVVEALLRAYAAAPATTVPVTITPGDASTSRLLVDPGTLFRDGPEQLYRQPVSTAFLRVRVGGPSCSARTVPIRTAYVADTPSWDFATAHRSTCLTTPGHDRPVRARLPLDLSRPPVHPARGLRRLRRAVAPRALHPVGGAGGGSVVVSDPADRRSAWTSRATALSAPAARVAARPGGDRRRRSTSRPRPRTRRVASSARRPSVRWRSPTPRPTRAPTARAGASMVSAADNTSTSWRPARCRRRPATPWSGASSSREASRWVSSTPAGSGGRRST